MRCLVSCCVVLGSGGCFTLGPELDSGSLDGIAVVGAMPLRGATIVMEQIGDDGVVIQQVKTTQTDGEGRFWLDMEEIPGPFLLSARGGITREFWSDEDIAFDDDVVMRSAILDDEPGDRQTA